LTELSSAAASELTTADSSSSATASRPAPGTQAASAGSHAAAEYFEGIRQSDRTWTGKAITLVESTKPQDQAKAAELIDRLLPLGGGACRIGVTGVPGAGKSTLIDALGSMVIQQGKKVGVLAVDPSSSVSGGSILGDKTRMNSLAQNPNAFIRPSPTLGKLGGATRAAREVLLILEAAGYGVVFVETVGVGQSEAVVADMVDFFMLVLIPGAGDELQGIKRGVVELADHVVVNKAEGDNAARSKQAAAYYRNALKLLTPQTQSWQPSVSTCSALRRTGLEELWEAIEQHRHQLLESGELQSKRRGQQVRWMWSMVEDRLMTALRQDKGVASVLDWTVRQVSEGKMSPPKAAASILEKFEFKL